MRTARKIADLTSNEYYGGLNHRFEKRAAQLVAAGYKYRQICPGVAVFHKIRFGRETNITASEALHAHNRAWRDTLANAGIR